MGGETRRGDSGFGETRRGDPGFSRRALRRTGRGVLRHGAGDGFVLSLQETLTLGVRARRLGEIADARRGRRAGGLGWGSGRGCSRRATVVVVVVAELAEVGGEGLGDARLRAGEREVGGVGEFLGRGRHRGVARDVAVRVLGLVVLERGAARVVVVDAPGRKLGLEEVSDSRLLGDVEGKAVHAERRQHAHELVQLISVESSLEEEGGKASTNARGRRCRIHVVVATTIIRAREAIGARRDAHLALGLFEVRLETGENLRTEIIVRALHGEDRAFRARAIATRPASQPSSKSEVVAEND